MDKIWKLLSCTGVNLIAITLVIVAFNLSKYVKIALVVLILAIHVLEIFAIYTNQFSVYEKTNATDRWP